MKIRLTPVRIRELRPSLREFTVWDTETPHFGVRVRPNGEMRYVHLVRRNGKLRKTTIGDARVMPLDDARVAAAGLDEASGTEAVARRPSCPTFGEWVEQTWWPQTSPHHKPGTRKRHRIALDKQLLPAFGEERLDEIDRDAILAWFERHSLKAPGGANRELEILRSILNHAVRADVIPRNPAKRIPFNPKKRMTRFLSEPERERLLAELDGVPEKYRIRALAIKMLLFTGCRRNEILALRWSEVGDGVLHLADSKVGPRKVWLGEEALAILDEARAAREDAARRSDYVFPHFRYPDRYEDQIDFFWRDLRARAGLNGLRLHALRHSFASEAVRQKVALPVVQKLLGHGKIEMTMRYTHISDTDVEEAANRVGNSLAAMLDGEE